ncbi:ATP-dependent DNA helicase PIF2-like [Coffea eugenioides]|uniref:ATP-dependent DNA helicase PIF2-like n=1 Tax=Coffea eugenioides TaxID=49369 RepID=UPI000F6114A8|nr:ATP-dependent DNA helicase PIF2-like [Coffea eugenioides]
MESFREAALALGLLQFNTYIEETLEEAAAFQMPSALILLFATLLVYCSPTDPTILWRKFELDFSRDYELHKQYNDYSPAQIRGLILADVNRSLQQISTTIAAYQLPLDDLVSVDQQKYAYDTILQACFASQGHSFFIDGPGSTSKTFLYRSLLATLRLQGFIAIAVATSGIAASILPGGRTAHSRFKIPLDFSKNRTCQLSKQGSVARLLLKSKLILWDEASMAKRATIEAFDDLLRDIMESKLPFGGKVVVFDGDFRQTLPVIEQATKEILLQSCFLNSPLWYKLHKLKLTENMRAILDPQFSEFLLRVGEGREPIDFSGEITLPRDLVIPYYDKEESLNRLLYSVFPDFTLYSQDPYSMINRCILIPKNTSVDELNDIMIRRFPGELQTYISFDKTVDQWHQGDYEDFLNS